MKTKSEERRAIVLDAAVSCFIEQGFHSTSMAKIAKKAKMSQGHIYHYYKKKEEIVEEIAKKESLVICNIIDNIIVQSTESDIVDQIILHLPIVIERSFNKNYIALMLELSAEATRNKSVHGILQAMDAINRSKLVNACLKSKKNYLTKIELEKRVQLFTMLFNGLTVQAMYNNSIDKKALIHEFILETERLFR